MALKLTRAVPIVRSDYEKFTDFYRRQFLRAGQVAFVNVDGTPDPKVILPNIQALDEEQDTEVYGCMFVRLVDDADKSYVVEGWLCDFTSYPDAMNGPDMGSFFKGGSDVLAGVGICQSSLDIEAKSPESEAMHAALTEFGSTFEPTVTEENRLDGPPFRDAT